MASILCSLVHILILFSFFHNGPSSASFALSQPLCHKKESNALLEFKHSLTIDISVSHNPFARNKIASWKLEGESNSNCCSWDGVKCDKDTGHVIGLDLSSSFLFGSINSSSSLFTLVHLQLLNLADNDFNYSHIPSQIGSFSGLKSLNLSKSYFVGPVPQEISQLFKLVSLDLNQGDDLSSTSGLLRLENHLFKSLLQNLTLLEELSLSGVNISSQVPDMLAKLSSLKTLLLSGCNLSGPFPASIGNLSHLTDLSISDNSFSGQFPSLAGLSKLRYLHLGNNNLLSVDDLIWLRNLTNLTDLSLSGIDLNGSILATCHNQTHAVSDGLYSTTTLPKFKILVLDNCNLKAFPDFLRYQDELEELTLSENKIHAQIPTWLLNVSRESLGVLILSYNFLTDLEQHQATSGLSNLRILSLRENMIQGPLPIPPPNLISYSVSGNSFTGKIPTLICRLNFLIILKMENNNLSGNIPPCLGNFSDYLSILTLGGNNLQGPIPCNFNKESKLKIIDLSHNRLQGKIPGALKNCRLLKSLDLSSNLIEDVFPFWLGSLSNLQILLLGSNKLGGAIGNSVSEVAIFPNLRILDLSYNNFTGHIPENYFLAWNAMRYSAPNQDEYMLEFIQDDVSGRILFVYVPYAMTITNKGVNVDYEKISSIFTAIDISSNRFEGEIPKSIGILKGLELLNLSNNGFYGEIPSNMGNLNNLESLDISHNKLSGKIPQELTQLNFLEVFNISYNNLTGRIPRGKQFNTFQNDSYIGNLGLCRDPFSRKSESVTASVPLTLQSREADDGCVFLSGIEWIVIGLGYGTGVIVGVVVGRILISKYEYWFIETFERLTRKHVS